MYSDRLLIPLMEYYFPSSLNQNLSLLQNKKQEVSLAAEIKYRYLTYAYSVITSRALPDIRDGLKPVQRRILFSMFNDLQLLPHVKHRKSASIIGDVLGKYHPHGDSSVYDALVRMAQNFSLRYPLIDGQGNFGSQDGDTPAAYRYTECKLQIYSLELLTELDQTIVHYQPTFDGMRSEPIYFPARLPNILLNGAQGIGVGMATWIPPHNITEVLTACIALIENNDLSEQELLKIIKGPDFPTGGEVIISSDKLLSLYQQGHGSFLLRGQYKIEEKPEKKTYFIVIYSIPYGINKSLIIEEIHNFIINNKHLPIISYQDESTNDIRIILEVTKGTDPDLLMKYIYQQTKLQIHIHVNFTCLIPEENYNVSIPKQLSLKECLTTFLSFRFNIITRRLSFNLQTIEEEIHILDGFQKIYQELETAIELIKTSNNKLEAVQKIQTKFELDNRQAIAIVEMKFYRLTKFEMKMIYQNLNKKKKEKEKIIKILGSNYLKWNFIKKEYNQLLHQLSDTRRTQISTGNTELYLNKNSPLPSEQTFVIITKTGWIKRVNQVKDATTIRIQEGDEILCILNSSTTDNLLLFTNFGNLYTKKTNELLISSRYGEPIQKFFPLMDNERIINAFSLEHVTSLSDRNFICLSKHGIGAQWHFNSHTQLSFNVKKRVKYIKLSSNDEIIGVFLSQKEDPLLIITNLGKKIICPSTQIPLSSMPSLGKKVFQFDEDSIIGVAINCNLHVQSNRGRKFIFRYHKNLKTVNTIQETIILKKGRFLKAHPVWKIK